MSVDITAYRAAIGLFNNIRLSGLTASMIITEYIFVDLCFYHYALPYVLVIGGVNRPVSGGRDLLAPSTVDEKHFIVKFTC